VTGRTQVVLVPIEDDPGYATLWVNGENRGRVMVTS
jgi:hypothetical protein